MRVLSDWRGDRQPESAFRAARRAHRGNAEVEGTVAAGGVRRSEGEAAGDISGRMAASAGWWGMIVDAALSEIFQFLLFCYCLRAKKGYSMGDCALTTGGVHNV